ncbi:hypothetical protein L1049_010227 [Liquidambar formosana]|uniref:Uncharacterized protein n=1 Tax=Liquidambar formosana TaxID=63359 RepID=A0AAP0R1N9_LIQFO
MSSDYKTEFSWFALVQLSGWVDELKIFTEEELVNKAFEEAFKDGEETSNSLQFSEEHSNAGRTDNCRISSNKRVRLKCSGRGRNLSASFESLNGSPSASGCNGQNSSRKRKRRVRNNRAVENSYIAKVEQLAKIKQKQDEDKAAARLHSFKFINNCKINECAAQSSEKIETMTSLKSMNSATKFV